MNWWNPINFRMIPTLNRKLKVEKGQTHLPISPHPGAYGVRRKHHTHEGVDLYCPVGTPVFPVEDGKIVAIIPFTGPSAVPPSPWWNDTQAVLVEGPSGVVVYGEIKLYRFLKVGKRVGIRDCVGFVEQVLKVDKGFSMSMLHLELHKHGTRDCFEWIEEKPKSLKDPTEYLLRASYMRS